MRNEIEYHVRVGLKKISRSWKLRRPIKENPSFEKDDFIIFEDQKLFFITLF